MSTENANPPPDAEEVAPAADVAPREGKPDREAAKYRRQLRETEARATALSSRLETMQRREVERLAAADLASPADLWLTGPDLSELLNGDGDVDPAKVTAAVAAALESRPGWRRPDPPPSADGGVRRSAPVAATMRDVLQGRRRPG